VISTGWSRAGGKLGLHVKVPPNVAATVHVPSRKGGDVMESGDVLEGGRREEGSVVFEVGSGEYHFTADY
jgi:hypothetical protein